MIHNSYLSISLLCFFSIASNNAISQQSEQNATQINDCNETPGGTYYVSPPEAKTIYHNVSGLSSRRGHATKLTQLHKTQAQDDWAVVDIELHHENGDLEGFYITYSRTRRTANNGC